MTLIVSTWVQEYKNTFFLIYRILERCSQHTSRGGKNFESSWYFGIFLGNNPLKMDYSSRIVDDMQNRFRWSYELKKHIQIAETCFHMIKYIWKQKWTGVNPFGCSECFKGIDVTQNVASRSFFGLFPKVTKICNSNVS